MRARRWRARTCSCSAALLLTIGASAGGQSAAFTECNADAVGGLTKSELGPWVAFTPESLKRRFEPVRRAGAWSAIADSVAMLFGLEARPAALAGTPGSLATLPDSVRALLVAELDSLRAELAEGERDSVARLNGRITTKRFAVEPRLVAPQRVSLFVGRPPGPIVISALPDGDVRPLCWFALTLNDLATLYGGSARAALAAALAKRAARWDNFMQHGYSMTPLELFVNGYMPRRELEPPRHQLVLFHASAGAEMFSDRPLAANTLRAKPVLVVEPLGLLRYFGQFKSYGGVTWVLAFPDSGGLATGVMLHHSDIGHVSYLWRPGVEPGASRGALLLSMDLYRYLAGAADKWKQLERESVSQCLADAPACVARP